jgi:glycosyltransferase involved in cell wall biosynthesis
LVSVVIPTIRTRSIGDAIESVLRQTDDNWELVVVPQGDDGQLIDLLEQFRARDSRVSFVHTQTKNASHARNVGIRAARGDVIAFTDDDCEAAPDWVAVIREIFTSRPDIGYIGGEVVAPPNPQWWRISTCPAAHVIDGEYHPFRDGRRAPHGFYMIGANIAVRREIVDAVGPWDEVLGPGGRFPCCEDQDFGFRAEAIDTSFLTAKRLVVHHTTGRRSGVREFFRHQRNYALGRGAWGAKLQLWGHPMAEVWGRGPTASEHLKAMLTRPHQWLLSRWAEHHVKRAAAEYSAHFEVGDDALSHRREATANASMAVEPA